MRRASTTQRHGLSLRGSSSGAVGGARRRNLLHRAALAAHRLTRTGSEASTSSSWPGGQGGWIFVVTSAAQGKAVVRRLQQDLARSQKVALVEVRLSDHPHRQYGCPARPIRRSGHLGQEGAPDGTGGPPTWAPWLASRSSDMMFPYALSGQDSNLIGSGCVRRPCADTNDGLARTRGTSRHVVRRRATSDHGP